MKLADAEISRALNAVSTTLRDQRPSSFDADRVAQIARGALAGEAKLEAVATGRTRGELRRRDDGRLAAVIELSGGRWRVKRMLRAGESNWALPRPAHRR